MMCSRIPSRTAHLLTTTTTRHPARVTTMDKNELERYQVQLSQVELALASDPENTELASLRSELKELIDLLTGSA